MILDATTQTLEAILAGAKTTVDCPVIVDYVDNTTTAFTPGVQITNTNGVAAVKTKGKDDSPIRTIEVGYVKRLQDEVRALGERIHAQREEINRLHYLGD